MRDGISKRTRRWLYVFLMVLFCAVCPVSLSAEEQTLTASDGNLTVNVTDSQGQLPDGAKLVLKKGSALRKVFQEQKAKQTLDALDQAYDGSFVTQRYEDASVKESDAYLYDVAILYEENGEEKEYQPSGEDGVTYSFSVRDYDSSRELTQTSVFAVTKNTPELIMDATNTDAGTTVTPQESGRYLILAADYIAKAGSSDQVSAQNQIAALLEKVYPEKFLTDPLASTYTDEQFAQMRAAAQEAISGQSSDYARIEALTKLVANHTYYDYPYAYNGESLTALNPYDVWNKQISVCDGYSRLMETLCISVNIPCFRIYSDDHAYNACYDRGNARWVVVDTTWASGNKYTTDHELRAGDYNASYFDMKPSFLARISNHECFSLSNIKEDAVFYTYVPNYKATSWANMTWDTWTDQTDWHLKVSGLLSGTSLQVSGESYCGLPVTEVASMAFDGSNLTDVSLPASIREVEVGAFRSSQNLNRVAIAGSQDLTVLSRAFYGDTALTQVDIEDRKLSYVGDSAFCNDEQLSTFGDGTLCVGDVCSQAFRMCKSLSDTIQVTGDRIDDQAFYNCEVVPAVDAGDASASSLGVYVFRGCTSLKSAVLPDGITALPSYLFYGCTALERVELPVGQIASGGKSAFHNCSSLVEPSDWSKAPLTELPESFFRNNTARTSLTLPDGLTSIGYASLAGCTGFSSLDLSNTMLASVASYGLYGLDNLSFFAFPSTLVSSDATSYQRTADDVRQTFVTGIKDQGTLAYTKDNTGAWKGRKVSFGSSVYTAVFENGEDTVRVMTTPEVGAEAPVLTKDYYTFDGWKNAKGALFAGGTQICEENGSGEVVYTPVWTPVTYRISYALNGGTNHKENPETYTVGSAVSLKDPTFAGHSFTGWFLSEDSKDPVTGPDTAHPADVTLYARWDCNHEQTETRNASGATCKKAGYTGDTVCADCGFVLQAGQVIPVTDHDWDYVAKAKAATCVQDGNPAYWHCSLCDSCFADAQGSVELSEEEMVISRKTASHTLTQHDGVEPTCKKEGTEAYWTCSLCGKYFSDAKGTQEILAPVSLAKKDHAYDQGVVTREATCAAAGKKLYTCTVCGTTKEEAIPAPAHMLVKHEKVSATCQAVGTDAYYSCKVCEKLFADSDGRHAIKAPAVLPVVAHTFGSRTVVKKASCTAAGLQTCVCTVCGRKEESVVPATGHRMVHRGSNPGYYACSVCGKCYEDAAGKTEISGGIADPVKIVPLKSPTLVTKNKKVKLSWKKGKKKQQTVRASVIGKGNRAKTKISYQLVKVNKKKFKKYFKVAANGKLIVKKNLKKGTYKITIRAKTPETAKYFAARKNFTVTVIVR